jgi:hypothetical protein
MRWHDGLTWRRKVTGWLCLVLLVGRRPLLPAWKHGARSWPCARSWGAHILFPIDPGAKYLTTKSDASIFLQCLVLGVRASPDLNAVVKGFSTYFEFKTEVVNFHPWATFDLTCVPGMRVFLGFEVGASCLLGRYSYFVNHSSSSCVPSLNFSPQCSVEPVQFLEPGLWTQEGEGSLKPLVWLVKSKLHSAVTWLLLLHHLPWCSSNRG